MKRLQMLSLLFAITLGVTNSALASTNPFISTCTTITQSGSYLLVSDITAGPNDFPACIVIAADYVTLDLTGHTIFGSQDTGGSGIAMSGTPPHGQVMQQGVTVRNGSVVGFGNNGVRLDGPANAVENIHASGNSTGIATFGDGTTVRNNIANSNTAVGMVIEGGAGHNILGNVLTNNPVASMEVTCPSLIMHNASFGNGNADQPQPVGVGCTQTENNPLP